MRTSRRSSRSSAPGCSGAVGERVAARGSRRVGARVVDAVVELPSESRHESGTKTAPAHCAPSRGAPSRAGCRARRRRDRPARARARRRSAARGEQVAVRPGNASSSGWRSHAASRDCARFIARAGLRRSPPRSARSRCSGRGGPRACPPPPRGSAGPRSSRSSAAIRMPGRAEAALERVVPGTPPAAA